jgi:hypothetical protein
MPLSAMRNSLVVLVPREPRDLRMVRELATVLHITPDSDAGLDRP